MPKYPPLTAREKDQLEELADAGKPIPFIARKLRRSQSIVYRYIRAWNIPLQKAPSTRHVTQQDIEEAIYEYQNNGVSYSDSASELGIYDYQLKYLVERYLDKKFLKKFDIQEQAITVVSNGKDPRSIACQTIKTCSHYQCQLHWRCPAYQNYVQKRSKI